MPEFEIRREVELPASPEDVWEAVATGPGNAAWLFPADIPGGEGATTADGSKITAWDPPHHFAVRAEGDGWFNALEFIIEARDGGTAVLRYVHSGIIVDDWDSQYDAVNQHTDFYLHTLGQYLAHFKGRRAQYIGDVPGGIAGPDASARPDGFDRVRAALGLAANGAEGAAVTIAPPGLDPVSGVVDYAQPNFLGIRTDDALVRLFGRNAFGGPVGLAVHHFGNGVDPAAQRTGWEAWLGEVFA